ncbi:MAG: ACP S-malonyltransferase, partial [Kofleriaceae bacterium]
MTVALVFAGQGVDPPWIDPALLATPAAPPLLAAASAATGVDVGSLLARGGRALAQVEVLQPALVAACLIAHAAVAPHLPPPAATAGHSLGELTAWAATGAIAGADAISAAAVRGRLMAREAARHPGGMAALTGPVDVAEVLATAAPHGRLTIAAHNAPGETVVSGDVAALTAVLARYPGRRLPVAGAWHSPAMGGAVDELHAALAVIPRQAAVAPLVANRTGAVVEDGAAVPRLLAEQLIQPVAWATTLATLAARGVTRYVAVGPGRLLRALIRANLGDVRV